MKQRTWPKNIYLVRHGESEGNIRTPTERAQYTVAPHAYELTPSGCRQAIAVRDWLTAHKILGPKTTVYSSYYRRARVTAGIIVANTKLEVVEDPRLAEAQRGFWHSMTRDAVEARYPNELERIRREGLYHYRPFGGENWPDVELRIHSFLDTLCRDHARGAVVIVGHGHWILLFRRLIERFSIQEAVVRLNNGEMAANCSISHFASSWRRPALHHVRDISPWE